MVYSLITAWKRYAEKWIWYLYIHYTGSIASLRKTTEITSQAPNTYHSRCRLQNMLDIEVLLS